MPTREETRSLKEHARRLRAQGRTVAEIAREVDRSERQVFNWLRGQPTDAPGPAALPKNEARVGPVDWPDDYLWPGWTVEDLRDLPDFDEGAWAANINSVTTAEAQHNYHVGWAYRRLVELQRESPLPERTAPWSLSIAAYPPLGAWLDCPAFEELAQKMAESEPWLSSGNRTLYRKRAASAVWAARVSLQLAQAGITPGALLLGGNYPVAATLFGELYTRVLEPDLPLRSTLPGRRFAIKDVLFGLLSLPKEKLS